MTLLQVAAIETFYGPSQALFGVDLEIGDSEVVTLMGRNGMGKSTTIRSICGMTPARAGRIEFAGARRHRPCLRTVRGWASAWSPKERRCFPNLTVHENLIASARPGKWTLAAVRALFPRLGERMAQYANTLSGGEQQMLAVGRALMTNPRLLILDEATEGLAPVIRQDIWSAIRKLKADGQAILVVDKTMDEVLAVADRCVVLEKGRTVWTGSPAGLTRQLQDRYLGF